MLHCIGTLCMARMTKIAVGEERHRSMISGTEKFTTIAKFLDVAVLVCHTGHSAVAEVAGHPLITTRPR